jgi:maltooligosyltrehalose trehalohydrolase
MHRFEIWAPLPKKLVMRVNSQDHSRDYAMTGPDEFGHWYADIDDANPGSDYCFLIDGDTYCYPDPRSLWQPSGVHGMSRVYDQSAFAWTDNRTDSQFIAPPLETAILYELHIGTFTPEGTLDAAIQKLDYLLSLGITHVELMPVAAFPGNHGWGYDGAALFAVHQPYGGPDALKRFVDAAHGKGLAVLLDVVYNHFGPVGNYTGKFAPYLVDTHHTPWGGAVNLEGEWSHEVRRFFIDNALMWMRDFHLDGLRLDAIHAFVDRSAIHFLEQLSAETEALGKSLRRTLVLIAESDLNDPLTVTPRGAGGHGSVGGHRMDAQWSDDFHHALFTVLHRGPRTGYYADFGQLAHLAKALEQTFVYDGLYSFYRNRVHGKSVAHIPQNKFLGFIQNHDQVGNRATGDRLREAVGTDRARVAAAIVLFAPFVPMLFQGEEWAASSPFQYFADHEDPDMARAVFEGRKREFAVFGWPPELIPNPEKRETFERSKLHWTELAQPDHAAMLAWYRSLIHFRRTTPALNNAAPGNTRVLFDEQACWISIARGNLTLLCNLDTAEHPFPIPTSSRIILCSRELLPHSDGSIALPPDTALIFNRPS